MRAVPCERAILAGPTCDSMDVIYRRADYRLPLDLAIGDPLDFLFGRCLHGELCFGGVQRLRADSDLLHLSPARAPRRRRSLGPDLALQPGKRYCSL